MLIPQDTVIDMAITMMQNKVVIVEPPHMGL